MGFGAEAGEGAGGLPQNRDGARGADRTIDADELPDCGPAAEELPPVTTTTDPAMSNDALLIVTIILQVVLRYGFSHGLVVLEAALGVGHVDVRPAERNPGGPIGDHPLDAIRSRLPLGRAPRP